MGGALNILHQSGVNWHLGNHCYCSKHDIMGIHPSSRAAIRSLLSDYKCLITVPTEAIKACSHLLCIMCTSFDGTQAKGGKTVGGWWFGSLDCNYSIHVCSTVYRECNCWYSMIWRQLHLSVGSFIHGMNWTAMNRLGTTRSSYHNGIHSKSMYVHSYNIITCTCTLINPRRMREGCSSRSVCVCVCVCVSPS